MRCIKWKVRPVRQLRPSRATLAPLLAALLAFGALAAAAEPADIQPADIQPADTKAAVASPSHPIPARPRYPKLPPPTVAANWDAFKLQAATRLVQAQPDSTYLGTPPAVLYGIPVLEVELRADGSVRHVHVVREPVDAKETVAMAIAAVRRAAPFGSVSHLPRPWIYVEVFLFDEDLRFMPATLDR